MNRVQHPAVFQTQLSEVLFWEATGRFLSQDWRSCRSGTETHIPSVFPVADGNVATHPNNIVDRSLLYGNVRQSPRRSLPSLGCGTLASTRAPWHTSTFIVHPGALLVQRVCTEVKSRPPRTEGPITHTQIHLEHTGNTGGLSLYGPYHSGPVLNLYLVAPFHLVFQNSKLNSVRRS